MRYLQIKGENKLHLVFEYKGFISHPICGRKIPKSGYKMTINVPLGHACKKCQQISNSKLKEKEKEFLLSIINKE